MYTHLHTCAQTRTNIFAYIHTHSLTCLQIHIPMHAFALRHKSTYLHAPTQTDELCSPPTFRRDGVGIAVQVPPGEVGQHALPLLRLPHQSKLPQERSGAPTHQPSTQHTMYTHPITAHSVSCTHPLTVHSEQRC